MANLWDRIRRKPAATQKRTDGPTFSIGDPGLAAYLGLGNSSAAGVPVTERSTIGLTAVYRSVAIIAGTIASLPMKSFRTLPDATRSRVASVLDNPGGPGGLTPFEWKEMVMAHLLLHGNAYLLHQYGGAGQLVGLPLVHPSTVSVSLAADGTKRYTIPLIAGGTRTLTGRDLTHIMALGTDGVVGLSPIEMARNALGTAIAGDNAAARMFANGLLLGGIVSTDETLDEDQAEDLKHALKAKLTGSSNVGDIAVVSTSLKFAPWTMKASDAQFIESRQMQIAEVARLFGVPKVLLAEDGASTWGAGIAELMRGFARFTLAPWTARIEERLSALLPQPRFCEFDYAGLLQPTHLEMVQAMALEIDKGLLTPNEGRRILNRPPIENPEAPDETAPADAPDGA